MAKFGGHVLHHLASRLANVIREGGMEGGRLKTNFLKVLSWASIIFAIFYALYLGLVTLKQLKGLFIALYAYKWAAILGACITVRGNPYLNSTTVLFDIEGISYCLTHYWTLYFQRFFFYIYLNVSQHYWLEYHKAKMGAITSYFFPRSHTDDKLTFTLPRYHGESANLNYCTSLFTNLYAHMRSDQDSRKWVTKPRKY